jgi:hypothetical protein
MSAEKPLEFCVRSISCPGLLLIMVKKIKPELWIYYAEIYDRMMHWWQGSEFKDCRSDASKYRQKLQKKFDKIEREVFDQISKASGLKWHKPVIDCYIVQKSIPFSTPLTLPMRPDLEAQMEVIIHELVHNILFQNFVKHVKKYNYSKKYGKLSRSANTHVLVHAILKEVLLEIYGEKKTKEFIKSYDKLPADYKKAWDIVNKEGSKKIIEECIKK